MASEPVSSGVTARAGTRLRQLPLMWQLGAVVLPGMVLLLGIFAGLGMLIAQQAEDLLAKSRMDTAVLLAGQIDYELHDSFNELEWGAMQLGGKPADVPQVRTILRDIAHPLEDLIVRVFLVNVGGRLLAAEPAGWLTDGTDMREYLYVARPLASGQRYVSGVAVDEETRRPSINITVPLVGSDGAVVGVLGATLEPVNTLLSPVLQAASQMGDTGHTEVVDQNLRLVLSNERNHVLGRAEHPTFYAPLLARHESAIGVTDPIGDEDPADTGQRHVMAFVPLSTAPWGVAVGGTQSTFTALTDRWRWETVPLTALWLAVAIYVSWATRQNIVRSLRALTRTSESIGRGDLATPVPSVGQGEVRAFAERFDEMRRKVQLAQDALAEEKSRYERMIESMTESVICTDANQRITAFNRAAETLTGWSASDALDELASEVLPLATPERAELVRAHRAHLRRRDGSEVTVAGSSAPIHGQGGDVRGTVLVMRDVSGEVEVDRLKDELLASVTHELRTPIGCIKGFATTLLLPGENWDASTIESCLKEIVGASEELQDLVDNLLDMSRISAGGFTVVQRPVDVASMFASVVQRFAPRARGHALRVQMPRPLPPVLADVRRIEQVLQNLLDNAIKYSPGGGQITLAARLQGQEITVSVADEGLGVSAEDAPRLFERFQRGTTLQVQRIHGCGLGLAICRGIIEAHGGRIWLRSPIAAGGARGRGTQVTFSLQVAAAAAPLMSVPRVAHAHALHMPEVVSE